MLGGNKSDYLISFARNIGRLFSTCTNDLYLVLWCLKTELVEEEEDDCVGVFGVFSMLLVRVLESVPDLARCWLSGSVIGCWQSGLVFPSVLCTSK